MHCLECVCAVWCIRSAVNVIVKNCNATEKNSKYTAQQGYTDADLDKLIEEYKYACRCRRIGCFYVYVETKVHNQIALQFSQFVWNQ